MKRSKCSKRSPVWFGIILFIMAAVFSCGDKVILVDDMGGGGGNNNNNGGGGGGGGGGGTGAPVIWGENVNRTSNESATISFTVEGVGTAYYLARTSSAPAPTNSEVILNGAPLGTVSGPASVTVRLTAGAQDVYIVIMDAAGNLSAPLKIPMPPLNINPSAPCIITESGLPKAADNDKSRLFKTANAAAAATSFKVTNGGRQIATGTIQDVLNAVRDAANGASVTLQFGNGTSTLDIGSASARLENSGNERWGAIRLTGKLRGSGASANTGVIYVNVTVNIIVAGHIENTSGGYAIYNNTPRPIIVEPGANIVGDKYNLDGNEGGGTDPCLTNPNAAGCGGGVTDPCATNPTPNCPNYCTIYPTATGCDGGGTNPCVPNPTPDCPAYCTANPTAQGCTITPAPSYTITFDANGGSVTPTSGTAGTDGRLASLPTPTRSGYTFDGWYTAATGGSLVTTGYVFSANTTIYAQWIHNNVTFFTDSRDNKTYKKVTIGTQTWMAENLDYNASGNVCYGNDPTNCATYGRLYDWETAKTACPVGWHLPSDAEWTVLTDFVGSTAGTKLKSGTGWSVNDGTDDYGFSALPGGYYSNYETNFKNVGNSGVWWTATEYRYDPNQANIVNIYDYNNGTIYTNSEALATNLNSVRCVAD